ncbi:hypothetical protein B0T09DRAFT_338215 [Sordaria sp. MPI-SDFR-AT-0083]|nr:hypothetical protein B0T09DRAFT_338215 [Sordaria sp. MPI-SDFR-AT-0083]
MWCSISIHTLMGSVSSYLVWLCDRKREQPEKTPKCWVLDWSTHTVSLGSVNTETRREGSVLPLIDLPLRSSAKPNVSVPFSVHKPYLFLSIFVNRYGKLVGGGRWNSVCNC